MKAIFKALALAVLLCFGTTAARADFRVYATFQQTNNPVQSNTLTINTNVLTWLTNITNTAKWLLLTNSVGGNATNLYNQIGSFTPTNVTLVSLTNSSYITLVGPINSNLTVTLVGSYGRVTYYTSAVGAAQSAAFPFTKESLASRQSYMTSVATGLQAYAQVPLRMAVDIPTGALAKVTLTNAFVGNGGRISFGVGTPDTEYLGFWGLETTGDGYPSLVDGAHAFVDVIDYIGEGTGIEDSASLLSLGSYWRHSPHLGTTNDVANFGDRLTNDWYTVNWFHDDGHNNYMRIDVPTEFHGAVSMFGGGGTISGISSFGTTNANIYGTANVASLNGNLNNTTNVGTLRGGTIDGAAVQNGTLSNMTTVGGTQRAAKTLGNFTIQSDISYTSTNFTSLINGNNIALDFGSNAYVHFTGALTGDGSICGLVNGREGKWFRLYNDQPYTLFLSQNTADPVVTNRFWHKWTSGDLGILPYGWADIVYDTVALRWTVSEIYPTTAVATNAVASYNGTVTNLHAYPANTNTVPLIISTLTGQTTNVFEIRDANSNLVWSINSAGVPSTAGAAVFTVLSNGIPISGSVTGINFVGASLLMTNVNGTVSLEFVGTVTTADLTTATNNVTTNMQARLTASNAVAIARANQVGADGTNALSTATNNVTTNMYTLVLSTTNGLYSFITNLVQVTSNGLFLDYTNRLTISSNGLLAQMKVYAFNTNQFGTQGGTNVFLAAGAIGTNFQAYTTFKILDAGTNGPEWSFSGSKWIETDHASVAQVRAYDPKTAVMELLKAIRFSLGFTNAGSSTTLGTDGATDFVGSNSMTVAGSPGFIGNAYQTSNTFTLWTNSTLISTNVKGLRIWGGQFFTNANGIVDVVLPAAGSGGTGIQTNGGTGNGNIMTNLTTVGTQTNLGTAGTAGQKLFYDTNGLSGKYSGIGSAPNNASNNVELLSTNGNSGFTRAFKITESLSPTQTQAVPYGLGSGFTVDTNARTISASGSGGSSTGLRVTNIVASTTNFLLFDLAQYDVFKVSALTNISYMFTNQASLTSGKAYVYFQMDTNGGRTLNSYGVYGGTIQTNATMQPTTNANALDVMEVLPGFFPTNLVAYWPQNFQPRIAFTNSLAGGGASKNFARARYNHIYTGAAVPITNTVGNTIVVFSTGNGANQTATVTDSLGNSYTSLTNFSGGVGNATVCASIAFNCAAGSNLVSSTYSGGDIALTVIEYSGVTAVDKVFTAVSSGGTATLTATTTDTDMFVWGWVDETTAGDSTGVLTAGSVAGTLVQYQSGHFDGTMEWLNSSAGFTAASHTLTGTGGANARAYIGVALK